jgi:hypothetical protein
MTAADVSESKSLARLKLLPVLVEYDVLNMLVERDVSFRNG